MPTPKYSIFDKVIIAFIIALYMLGYHFLLESGSRQPNMEIKTETNVEVKHKCKEAVTPKSTLKPLPDWPLDLGRYFYTIDIDPGYEMEDEEYEVVGKSGGNLIVRKHNDWPAISGHFEWFCNEKLTTTQQMYDYVVSHHKAILRQMQEVKRRGLSRVFDEASYYQDHYDEYLDDPEDEIRFPPEIFDANDE